MLNYATTENWKDDGHMDVVSPVNDRIASKELGVENIIVVFHGRLRCFGHVERMDVLRCRQGKSDVTLNIRW